MSITVDGKPVSFTALAGSVPLVTVPAGLTGAIAFNYSLPHKNFIVIAVLLGAIFFVALVALSFRRRD
jgi:hypothetical protein